MAVDGTPEAPIAATRVAPAGDASPAVPAAAAAAAPALDAPAAAAAPVIAESPVAVPAAQAVELVSERPSLLETFGKETKPTDKPAAVSDKPVAASDKPKDEAVKPAEAAKPETKPEAKAEAKAELAKPEGDKPAEAAKPEPLAAVEYKYELPPTLKMDDALKGEVHTAFDAFRADPAAGAQALIDLHAKTMADYAESLQAEALKNQHKAFNDTRSNWNKDWLADEQIGGAGHVTAMRAIARMRDQFVSDDAPGTPKYQADLKSFEDFLRITGAGDHPAFGRFLHNVARAFDEPSLPPANPKPVPQKPPGGRKADALYTHPSSQKAS